MNKNNIKEGDKVFWLDERSNGGGTYGPALDVYSGILFKLDNVCCMNNVRGSRIIYNKDVVKYKNIRVLYDCEEDAKVALYNIDINKCKKELKRLEEEKQEILDKKQERLIIELSGIK